MKRMRAAVLWLNLLIACVSPSVAQSLRLTLWRDSITTSVGTTFTNRLTVQNSGAQKQEITLAVSASPAIQFLSAVPDRLVLLPGEVAMVPLKGLISRETHALLNPVTIRVSSLTDAFAKSLSFQLLVKEKAQPPLTLYTSEETLVQYSGSAPVSLPLQLVHNRKTRIRYAIEVTSMPEGVDRTAYPLVLTLASRQDTSVAVPVKPLRQWAASSPYQLVVTVRDTAKAVVGTIVYKLIVATSSKRFTAPDGYSRDGFGASAALTKLSTNQWAREARVWGSDSVGKAQVDFQIHYLDYTTSQFRQLQNSFLSFRTPRTEVRLGSSYDYHELPLFGRGLKVSVTQPNHRWTVWAVNANPNWFDSGENAWQGNLFSVRYDRPMATLPNGSWSFSGSYFTQSANQRAGYLTFGSLRFDQWKRHSLEVLAGQSVEFARHGPDRAQVMGWAGQLNYTYESPRFRWQWRSYFSSPVYAGLQKGATLLNSLAVWQPSAKTTLTARLSHLHYNPVRFVSPVDSYRSVFGNTVAEVSAIRQVGSLTLSLRPYWYAQSDFTTPYGQQADAYRIAPSLSYRRGNRRFDLTYDVGTFRQRAGTEPTHFLSQRIVSSAALGPFSLWGYWQTGPYYLSDLRNSQPDRAKAVSISPMVTFSLLNRRLFGSAGVNYLYDALFTGGRGVVIGRVQYDVNPNCWIRLEGNSTPYSDRPEMAFSQYRLELNKQFKPLSFGRRGQLQLSFFEDANGNSRRDDGERWMDSLLVTINQNTLLTNARGTIVYRNLPPGTYAVSAISAGQAGDPVQYQDNVTVGRSVTRLVPILRTFRVKGQLRCHTSAYDRYPCDFSRFMIDVQRSQQTVSSTSPLPDGSFSIHVPPGDYTILVRDFGRQPVATVKTTAFTLSLTGQHPVFNWLVDGSTRSVEIKRFKAN